MNFFGSKNIEIFWNLKEAAQKVQYLWYFKFLQSTMFLELFCGLRFAKMKESNFQGHLFEIYYYNGTC